MGTFFWHDYETWGTDPSVDRPAQFAGVRTDEELNIIGEPLRLYCRPAPDVLPHPEACLVTGIAPQKALNEGVSEAEFIAQAWARALVRMALLAAADPAALRFEDAAATHFHGQRAIFGQLTQHTLSMDMRASVTLSPTLGVEAFVQPLVSAPGIPPVTGL